MDSEAFLGFPPPLLGTGPCRLGIRYLDEARGLLVLEKPGGILTHAHPFYPGVPALDVAMNRQWLAGKPEFIRLLGKAVARRLFSVFFLESEIAGAGCFAFSEAGKTLLRNACGSGLLSFRFRFVARDENPGEGPERVCELPLTESQQEEPGDSRPSMRVSHRYGKKARTRFSQVGHGESPWGLKLWQAEAAFLRPHQIRAHAAESGLRISGETLYGDNPPLPREAFYRRKAPGTTPVYPFPALCLVALEWPELSEESQSIPGVCLDFPLPVGFARLVELLKIG